MIRKIITGVIAAVLLATIAVFAAEKVKEKVLTEKPRDGGQMGQHERLLDQLVEAYKANDREKMGEIIGKMQERREKMREFVKFNRWHRWAHRRMMRQMWFGWGQGPQMAGPGWAMRGGWNQGYPMAGPRWGQFQAMDGCGRGPCCGMDNCGPMAGGFGQMPCQQGYMGMNNWIPQQGGPMQMRGWGRGFQREWTPGPGPDNMGQQEWNMPRHERQNVPPPEWGW
jgi:hypothetical protein